MGDANQEGSRAHANVAGGATADALLALPEAASEVSQKKLLQFGLASITIPNTTLYVCWLHEI